MAGGWLDFLRKSLGWLAADLSVTVTPASIALVWSVPTPTITTETLVTPAAVALVWVVPSPAIVIPLTVTPAAVALVWAVPAPGVGDVLDVNQKTLGGIPRVTLDVGGETLDLYVVAYTYREIADGDGSLSIYLDNRDSNFDNLAVDWPGLVRGAVVDLRRGLLISDTNVVTRQLPRCWVEALEYVHDGDHEGMLHLECLDWQGLLDVLSYEASTTFSSQTVQAIVTSVLGVAGLTLASGSFDTSLTIDHEASPFDSFLEIVGDLMDKVEDELYTGLDAQIQYKVLNPAATATYGYDWNVFDGSAHPLLDGTEIVESSPVFNKVIVIGGPELQYSGSAEDTTETTLTGQTRVKYIEDKSLSSNAECVTRATAELQFFQAKAISGTVVARPNFTLRMYDVISVGAPAWGGPAIAAGYVTRITERYGLSEWEQELEVGEISESVLLASEGALPGSRKRKGRVKRGSSRRKASTYRGKSRRSSGSGRRGSSGSRRTGSYRGHSHTSDQVLGAVPIGAIIMWSGAATPFGWALCNGSNGTPDLRDRFVVAAGPTYAAGSSGGAATVDLQHGHADGTLATDSDSHSHDVTGATASDGHGHNDTLAVANDSHGHNDTLAVASDSHGHSDTFSVSFDSHSHSYNAAGAGTRPDQGVAGSRLEIVSDNHSHELPGSVSNDSHGHSLNGSVSSDSHSHTDGTLATDSDGHSHDVTGATANAGSTTQDVLPPYYSLAFIMRIL